MGGESHCWLLLSFVFGGLVFLGACGGGPSKASISGSSTDSSSGQSQSPDVPNSLSFTEIQSGLDNQVNGTVDTWAPGTPRAVITSVGQFVINLLPGHSRNALYFDLKFRPFNSNQWKTIAGPFVAACSDPTIVADSQGRIHLLYPQSDEHAPDGQHCQSSGAEVIEAGNCHSGGNIWHSIISYDGHNSPVIKAVSTKAIWGISDDQCSGGNPQSTQRFGIATHSEENAIYLSFFRLSDSPQDKQMVARYDLNTDHWSSAVSIPTAYHSGQGVGYSYVAGTTNASEVYMISTVYDSAGQYTDVFLSHSLDSGKTWNVKRICGMASIDPNDYHACLTIDILPQPDSGISFAVYMASTENAYSPMGDLVQGKNLPYLFSSDDGFKPHPIQSDSALLQAYWHGNLFYTKSKQIAFIGDDATRHSPQLGL